MSPLVPNRLRPGVVVLALLLAALPARGAGTHGDAVLSEVLDRPAPGREALKSLRRSLTTPSEAARWRGLPQFGRDLFEGGGGGFTPVENAPVGPDYVLGPGDNLVLFVSGLRDTSFSLTLDREGKVFLPAVGSTFLWGLAFESAESLVRSRLATVWRNARIQVSMGRLRAIDVFVLGAATRPGKYTLSGLATAFHALSAAGGPGPLGSMRDVRVLRANREVARLDLYPFLLHGDRSGDVPLQSGDVVFVGLSQSQVGIQGAVVRPGVYESPGPMTLRTLLDVAGGPTAFADVSRIRVERVDAHGGFRLQDLPLDHGHGIDPDSLTLSAYDLVTVLPLEERMRNLVTLDGYVRHPGEYELVPGMTLAQLLTRDRLMPEASLEQAELRRVDPATFQLEVRTVNVRKVWSGEEDLPLRPLDAVTVFSSARFPHSISLEGEVRRPGTYAVPPGERLSQVLARAGGVTEEGHLPAATFLRRSTAGQSRQIRQEFLERQRLEMAEQRVRLLQAGDSAAARQMAETESALAAAFAARGDTGRVVLDLDERMRWVGTSRDPVIEDGDRLIVPPRPATVLVVGAVMNPGAVMAGRSGSFGDYLKLAGGASRDADLGRSYVIRGSGAALPRRAVSRIEPGDAIVVPLRSSVPGGVGRVLGGGTRWLAEIATTVAVVIAVARR
jgi:protein involved in polysaccharide export with SLBB domain